MSNAPSSLGDGVLIARAEAPGYTGAPDPDKRIRISIASACGESSFCEEFLQLKLFPSGGLRHSPAVADTRTGYIGIRSIRGLSRSARASRHYLDESLYCEVIGLFSGIDV